MPYFAPYVGVGVGYQWAHLSGFTASARQLGSPAFASDDTYGAIAYQFILGGAVPIPSVRGLAMTAEYRFFGVGSRKYNVYNPGRCQAHPSHSARRSWAMTSIML